MASTYTPLGVELMATGENAGTWGTKTNTNLNILEQIAGGYVVQTLNAGGTGANTTTLSVSDGSAGATLATRTIILGAESAQAITGNKIVTIPIDVENFYFIKNSTSNAYTVQLKYASGTGDSVTWATTDKGWKIIYATANDGTNPDIAEITVGGLRGGSDTQVQFNDSGSFGGDANLVWSASTGLNIGSQKELRLQDSSGGEYIGMKSKCNDHGLYSYVASRCSRRKWLRLKINNRWSFNLGRIRSRWNILGRSKSNRGFSCIWCSRSRIFYEHYFWSHNFNFTRVTNPRR